MYNKIDKSVPLVIDIDDTLLLYLHQSNWENPFEKYKEAVPNKKEIEKLNTLYEEGYTIILHTGRGWGCYNFTKGQLAKYNINHHELVMGKPQGVYIDTDSFKSLHDTDFIKRVVK